MHGQQNINSDDDTLGPTTGRGIWQEVAGPLSVFQALGFQGLDI
jgi:hypothetical protein